MRTVPASSAKLFIVTEDEPIVLHKAFFDLCLKSNNPANLIALYNFYYYTAKWQHTNQPKATTGYAAIGLKWSTAKVKYVKQELRRLGLIEDIVTRSEEGKIVGHYIKVNFIWNVNEFLASSPTSNEKTGLKTPVGGPNLPVEPSAINALSSNNINALSAGKKETHARVSAEPKSLWDDFFEHFPEEFRDNKDFARALRNFITHRKQKGKRPTSKACQMLAIKLANYPLPIATLALTRSVENSWTGVFPESLSEKDLIGNGNGSVSSKTTDPFDIIDMHFSIDPTQRYRTLSWDSDILQPALELFNGIGDQDKARVAFGICKMADWLKANQKRPEFKTIPDFGQEGYSIYAKWHNVIPSPFRILQNYVKWLEDQQWISNLTTTAFDSESKLFKNYLNEAQNDIGFDLLSGKAIS